jgi:lysophospholipase L1-like esterase
MDTNVQQLRTWTGILPFGFVFLRVHSWLENKLPGLLRSPGLNLRASFGIRTSRFGLHLLCLFAAITCAASAADKPLFGNARRVVFLGDSITYAGQYVEFIEAYMRTRDPKSTVEIINLGLPSETVSGLSEDGHAGGKFPRPDLHERLERVLAKTKPDIVVACYGINCGIYLPFDETRFAKYREGLQRLREKCAAAGAKVIHVTPPTFDEKQGGHPGYGNTLDRYSDWLLGQRKAGWDVVDLHGPMNRYLADQRAKDSAFFLAKDGVHCGETGHWIMARQILLHLGASDLANATDVKVMLAGHPKCGEVLKLVQQRQRMMKDAWLTATGHQRPGMKTGLPLTEAQGKAAELDSQIQAQSLSN